MSEATEACIREYAAASTEAQVGRGVRRHRSAPGAECAHLRCAAAPRTSSSTMTGAFMEIWSARVPSTRARSYLVMKRVVMRFSGGTAPPPPPPPVTICAGVGAWRSARARQRGRLLGRPPPRRTARRLCPVCAAQRSAARPPSSQPRAWHRHAPQCHSRCRRLSPRAPPAHARAKHAPPVSNRARSLSALCAALTRARTGVRAPARADRP